MFAIVVDSFLPGSGETGPACGSDLDALASVFLVGCDSLVFDPDERQPPDDLTLIFEAIADLDPHHQQLAKELLEAITHRAHAHRWQQPAAS